MTSSNSSTIDGFDVRDAVYHTRAQRDFTQAVIDRFVGRGDALYSLMTGGRLVTLFDGEAPVGMAHFHLRHATYSKRIVARVSGCYMVEAFRGRYWRRFLRAIERDAREHGAEVIEFAVGGERMVRLLILMGYSTPATICSKELPDE